LNAGINATSGSITSPEIVKSPEEILVYTCICAVEAESEKLNSPIPTAVYSDSIRVSEEPRILNVTVDSGVCAEIDSSPPELKDIDPDPI